MSLSLAADSVDNTIEISRADIIAAVLLHLAVLMAIVILQAWHTRTVAQLPPSVEVQLISGAQLQKLQQQARPKPEPVKAKPKPRPAPKPAPQSKPVARPKPAAAPKPKVEPDFDPFAPLVSTPGKSTDDHPTKAPPAVGPISPAPHLSEEEINRYSALIQQAVQRHWKVPADIGNITDPVVEMELNSDGSVHRLSLAISSGNAALDQSLLRAIEAAAPFVLPPQQFETFRHNRIRFHPLR